MDLNGDGKIDKDEMDQFLAQNGVDDDHRAQIVDELFNNLDADRDGNIDIGELSTKYDETFQQLSDKEAELKRQIIESNHRLREAKK